MRLALAAGAVVGVLAPAVGFFLVQRRQSLVGDGIGHVAFAGVAAGILLDVPPVLTALVAAVAGGVAIELLRSRGGTAGDQALALVFYTGIAARGRPRLPRGSARRRPLPVPLRLDPHRDAHRPGRHRRAGRGRAGDGRAALSPARGCRRGRGGSPRRRRSDRRAQHRGRHARRRDGGALHARRRDPARGGADGAAGERRDPRRVEHALGVPPLARGRARAPRWPGSRSRTTPTCRREGRSCSSRRGRSAVALGASALRGR